MRAATDVRHRLLLTLAGFGGLALVACAVAPLVGSTPIDVRRVFDRSVPFADNVHAQIFFLARLPRVLAAALVGCALALSGVVFQALLRNPLASPDTLGVSAGASLGAMLAIALNADVRLAGVPAVPLASFAGSLGALAIVYALASARRRGSSTTVLLLAGVAITALLSAVVRFVQFVADSNQTLQSTRWLMGSLDVGSYPPLVAALVPTAAAAAAMATLPRMLDLVSVGTESAAARGVNVERAERVALISASLATGAAVSLAGPVAFVGIVVPHLVRLIVGAHHRLVLPAAGLFGAAFLVLCDLLARTLMAPVEFPVGVVTAVIGGPFFLWLLFRRR
ncbi:MAG: iron ABC transporter permease [Acidimicrobiia bacterium]|nr:iron ABC transporter permease [Acidimicrobiia bacterium]